MTLTISNEQKKTLDQFKAAPRFSHSTPPRVKPEEAVRCEIFDKVRGQLFHVAVSDNEQTALDEAIAGLPTASKPMTPAELAVHARNVESEKDALAEDNARKDQELTELRARLGVEPDEELSTAAIIDQIEALDLEPPEGDKRTKSWRQAAMAMLNEAQNG